MAHNITIRAKAGDVHIVGKEEEKVTSDFKRFSDIRCEDEFVEYMDEPLKSKLISGYMSFGCTEKDEFYVETIYKAREELSNE